MTEQSEMKAEPPQERPFQFGIKVLFVPPVLLALSFAADAYLEQPPGGSLVALIWAVLFGSCYWLIHRTRKALRQSCILASIILLLTFLTRLPETRSVGEGMGRDRGRPSLTLRVTLRDHSFYRPFGTRLGSCKKLLSHLRSTHHTPCDVPQETRDSYFLHDPYMPRRKHGQESRSRP